MFAFIAVALQTFLSVPLSLHADYRIGQMGYKQQVVMHLFNGFACRVRFFNGFRCTISFLPVLLALCFLASFSMVL